ncbi:hypothetical protein BH18CHL2_BH18CHL2_07270 [soil metagenome]
MRVLGLAPGEALLHAAEQFQLGFDVRGPFEKRKRRRRVSMGAAGDRPDAPPGLEPPG